MHPDVKTRDTREHRVEEDKDGSCCIGDSVVKFIIEKNFWKTLFKMAFCILAIVASLKALWPVSNTIKKIMTHFAILGLIYTSVVVSKRLRSL